MKFSDWEPVYREILRDFGYDRSADVQARDLLASLVDGPTYDPDSLGLEGTTVAIAGAADSLATETDIARDADAVIAASTAADVLLERGITVDCLVTDLDGNPETVRSLNAERTPVVVHAHGDNRGAVRTEVPDMRLEYLVPTTQARPVDLVRNFGGFTDGDRAAFFADALGAERLVFPGWSFDDQSVAPEKQQKLAWAERLLYWLEYRRDERFDVLDGRRESLSLPSSIV